MLKDDKYLELKLIQDNSIFVDIEKSNENLIVAYAIEEDAQTGIKYFELILDEDMTKRLTRKAFELLKDLKLRLAKDKVVDIISHFRDKYSNNTTTVNKDLSTDKELSNNKDLSDDKDLSEPNDVDTGTHTQDVNDLDVDNLKGSITSDDEFETSGFDFFEKYKPSFNPKKEKKKSIKDNLENTLTNMHPLQNTTTDKETLKDATTEVVQCEEVTVSTKQSVTISLGENEAPKLELTYDTKKKLVLVLEDGKFTVQW